MKKTTFTLLTILILTLTACGSASNGIDPASVPQSGAPAGALPVTTQLILGTLKLEGTDQTVTAEQAVELLPLWQTLQVLSGSDTAADQETESLIAQIQETMTAEQMQAITGMNLTREDMFAIMQEQGLAMGSPASGQSSNAQSGNSSSSGGGGFQPGGGGMPLPPDERGPGVGFGGGQGSGQSPDQIATAQAARQTGSGNFIPPALINALIEYLEEKAGS